jgi:hypothetical protein
LPRELSVSQSVVQCESPALALPLQLHVCLVVLELSVIFVVEISVLEMAIGVHQAALRTANHL